MKAEIQKAIREYYNKFIWKKLDNLWEMKTFPKPWAHWNWIKQIGNLKRPITRSEIESVKKKKKERKKEKKTSGNKCLGPDGSLGNSTKHTMKNLHQSFSNSSEKTEERKKQYQNNL